MHIVNIMLSRHGGGIEQACVDYCVALQLAGCQVTAITAPDAWVNALLDEKKIKHLPLRNAGAWDVLASWLLRKMLRDIKADAVIAHANRPLALSARAIKGKVPLIAVAHNYNIRRYGVADAAFVITSDLAEKIAKIDTPPTQVFIIPNMASVVPPSVRVLRSVPVIGAMGRLVAKKGFATYLQALHVLNQQGISFHALLGGGGEEEAALRALAGALELENKVTFTGWVKNKAEFFANIDVFCLPSLHEPFGIVILEAFAHGVPVVSTNTEGPKDIFIPNHNGVVVEKNNPEALAAGLKLLLSDAACAERIAEHAFETLQKNYTHEVVGEKITAGLRTILSDYAKAA